MLPVKPYKGWKTWSMLKQRTGIEMLTFIPEALWTGTRPDNQRGTIRYNSNYLSQDDVISSLQLTL